MGVDFLDMDFRIQKEFGISIPVRDIEKIATVADLHNYLEDHMTAVWPCPHIPAFSRLTKGLVETTALSESEIDLETDLNRIIPENDRASWWNRLEYVTNLKLPELRKLERGVVTGCLVFLIGNLTFVVLATALIPLMSSFVFAEILVILSAIFCGKLQTQIDAEKTPALPVSDMRELTKVVASMNRPQLVSVVSTHYEEIWPRLVDLIVDVSGVDEEEVVPAARFVEDLSF